MNRTIFFNNKPKIIATSSIAGPKESQGCISETIEKTLKCDMFGEKSFEKAESKMMFTVIDKAIKNANKKQEDIDVVIAGDLLNQIIATNYALRNFKTGFLGVYNACATFSESLILGATYIDGKYLKNIVCATSSHFSSAERQYRYPLELGCTRPPQSQWTVTGAGACVLSDESSGIGISSATIGRVVDFGVTDANNMGAAMAPAASETIERHFKDLNINPNYYDLIVTGDLGTLGTRILKDLLWEKGYDIENQHIDCGELVYNICEKEYQGGSGAGCSSLVFCSYLYKQLLQKKLNKILLVSTGALLSSLSSQQGESIPGIAHAVGIES